MYRSDERIEEVILMSKRILALALCLVLALGIIPVVHAEQPGSNQPLPQEVAEYFTNEKFAEYAIVDCVLVDNYCFTMLKKGSANILYGFRKSNGKYNYWMRSRQAVPQTANAVEMGVYTGYEVDGSGLKLKYPTFGIVTYNSDGTNYDQVLLYSLISGQWLLKAYINTKTNVSVTFANKTLTYYSYTDRYTRGSVEGNFQRDVRYISASSIPTTLKNAQEKLTVAPTLPDNSELVAEEIQFTGGQKYDVYSGPGKDFLRGNNNKAALSTNDWIQVFGEEDGWLMVQYAINKDTYRFGYIPASALPKNTQVKVLDFYAVEASVNVDTIITDDPLFSNMVLSTIPAGTLVNWLASMGDWAYISTVIDNTPVRGFVNAGALDMVEYEYVEVEE